MSGTEGRPCRRDFASAARAVEVSVCAVRAFVRLRELVVKHGDLAKRFEELEHKTAVLTMNHRGFSRSTCAQLKQVFDAPRELMAPPDPTQRPIGFVTHEERGEKPSKAKAEAKP